MQFVIDFSLILAATAMALMPNFNGAAVPLDPSVTWGEGTCCMGNILSFIQSCPSLILLYRWVGSDPGSLMTGGGLSITLIQKHKKKCVKHGYWFRWRNHLFNMTNKSLKKCVQNDVKLKVLADIIFLWGMCSN